MHTERLKSISRAFDARAATYDDSTMHRELAAAVADFIDLTAVEDVLDVVTAMFLADGLGSPKRKADAYPADHLPFDSLAALTATAATHGFTISRSMAWSDGVDRLLIAEWIPR